MWKKKSPEPSALSLDADTICHMLNVITAYGNYIRARLGNLIPGLQEGEQTEFTINLLDLFHLLGNFEGRLVAGGTFPQDQIELLNSWDEELNTLTERGLF